MRHLLMHISLCWSATIHVTEDCGEKIFNLQFTCLEDESKGNKTFSFIYIYIHLYVFIQTDRYRYMVWITCGSSSCGACLSCYSSRSFTEGPTTVSAQMILSFGYSSPYRHVSEHITDRILLLIWQMARTSFWWVLCKWKPETIFRFILANNTGQLH